jgi:hypothetical protein
MQARRRLGYGSPVTPSDDEAADVLQAAYFRKSLCDERAQLCTEISKRRKDIGRRSPHSTQRLAQDCAALSLNCATSIGSSQGLTTGSAGR